VVYLAEELNLGRRVAIKTILPEIAARDRNAAAGFYNEARMNAGLDHAHIIPIYYIGQEQIRGAPVHYIVMEFVEGGDLDSVLTQTAVAWPQRLRWMRQIADGLAHAHQQGVIHRDLKLRNVFVAKSQNVKIGDFGLAKAMGSETKTIMKGLGTPAYVAPEQIQGLSTTASADIYSLGVMYYQLLTGRLPYDAPDAQDSNAKIMSICYQHVNAPIPSARALNAQVSAELDQLIRRMMAKAPEQRPASVDEVIQVLERAAHVEPQERWAFDFRWVAAPAALVVLIGGVYGAYIIWARWTVAAPSATPVHQAVPTSTSPSSPPIVTTPPNAPQSPAIATPIKPGPAPIPTPPSVAPPRPASPGVTTPPPTTTKPGTPSATPPPSTSTAPQRPTSPPSPPASRPSEPQVAMPAPESPARPTAARPTPPPAAPTPQRLDPQEMKSQLERQFRQASLDLTVDVSSTGVVTVTGVVDEHAQRDRALGLATRMPGVVDVKSRINVRSQWGR
jgi:serine/threonine-protein kinase